MKEKAPKSTLLHSEFDKKNGPPKESPVSGPAEVNAAGFVPCKVVYQYSTGIDTLNGVFNLVLCSMLAFYRLCPLLNKIV